MSSPSEPRREACSGEPGERHLPRANGTCGACGRRVDPAGRVLTFDGVTREPEVVYSVRIEWDDRNAMGGDPRATLGPYANPDSALREAARAVRKGATVLSYEMSEVAWRQVDPSDLTAAARRAAEVQS